ncbi:helicase-related protein [Micromonospora sp. NPDC049836]|uniref:helicase-related protein n=1 Tax=Micromonospora sp. NPDC049836 TaxID=3364274 RepID=UPI00378D3376
MFDPSRLSRGAKVRLPGASETVTLKAVTPGPFWEFLYETPAGGFGQLTLPEGDVPDLQVVDEPDKSRFDGDPALFRLGVEARRIRTAFNHDYAALAVSNVQPLPHQLDAVYGAFLSQPRLRFLLADDPGAGKTIMAGLYVKELDLRRSADRILIVTPANLRPQWARELKERFDLDFDLIDSATFEANPSKNPWDHFHRCIVSRDFLKTGRAKEAFDAAELAWDLAIVDEAHGYTVQVDARRFIEKKSERYKAAESISRKAHRLLLLTATPHSGKDASLWSLLRLLDMDAAGDRCPKNVQVPEHAYRKVPKEGMRDMAGNKLFKPRHPKTVPYTLEDGTDEKRLYDEVTDFVQTRLAEIKGDGSKNAAGFALTTMQRRLASSARAIRRTLERRLERIEKALEDPEGYLRARMEKAKAKGKSVVEPLDPDEVEDLTEEDLWKMEEDALAASLPGTVFELEAERQLLQPLVDMAVALDEARAEKKLTELLDVVQELKLRDDRTKQLLIFTEHKDTLDMLVEVLSKDFEVAAIHGGLRLAERIEQERLFRERAQIMVATEAAGEGINLQFCHLMVNYDIPWNPNRLEQRMGRIHRIGQTEDVYVFNLVAENTREGKVLATLLKKLERMSETLPDAVFDVIGELFAGVRLKDLMDQVVAGDRDPDEAVELLGGPGPELGAKLRERAEKLLADNALASHFLDWEATKARADRASERRLPPGYFERFFTDAITAAGGKVDRRLDPGTWRITRTPDVLVAKSRANSSLRRIAPEYGRLTFDKAVLARPRRGDDEAKLPPPELCGPGHPLFDALVDWASERARDALKAGCVLVDPDADAARVVRFVEGDVVDGNGELAYRSMHAIVTDIAGVNRQADFQSLYDLALPDRRTLSPADLAVPEQDATAMWARQHVLENRYQDSVAKREAEVSIQADFLRRSFTALLAEADTAIDDAEVEVDKGVQGAEGRLRKAELAKATLQAKRDTRLAETDRARSVTRGPVRVLGTCVTVPPGNTAAVGANDRRGLSDPEIEAIAVRVATKYEEGRHPAVVVVSVERDNVGFDLLSTLNGTQRRCIEVKGRAGVGSVELTWGEYQKAVELGPDYWLYVVLDCASSDPRLLRVQDPVRNLAGKFTTNLDVRFGVAAEPVIDAAKDTPA